MLFPSRNPAALSRVNLLLPQGILMLQHGLPFHHDDVHLASVKPQLRSTSSHYGSPWNCYVSKSSPCVFLWVHSKQPLHRVPFPGHAAKTPWVRGGTHGKPTFCRVLAPTAHGIVRPLDSVPGAGNGRYSLPCADVGHTENNGIPVVSLVPLISTMCGTPLRGAPYCHQSRRWPSSRLCCALLQLEYRSGDTISTEKGMPSMARSNACAEQVLWREDPIAAASTTVDSRSLHNSFRSIRQTKTEN